MKTLSVLPALRIALLLLCCCMTASVASAQTPTADLYKAKCASCHALDGSGNTPAGKALKVRDLRDAEVQKQTDEQWMEITAKGKNKMPGYEKSLKPEQIKALVAHMRALAKNK